MCGWRGLCGSRAGGGVVGWCVVWVGLGGEGGWGAGRLAGGWLAGARRQEGAADSGVTAAAVGTGLPVVATGGWKLFGEGTAATPNVLLVPVLVASLWTGLWRHQDFMEGANVAFRAALLAVLGLAG